METTTIAAIATPSGYGGIGIVKMSGPQAIRIARQIFQKKCPDTSAPTVESSAPFDSHRFYYGMLKDPDTGQVVDEVLLAVMKAPRSYTRENVVEIQAHAGPVALQAIMQIVMRAGAHLAAPGEFTRRAFMNGRIDLTQSEAVMDIIHAKSETALTAAGAQIRGRLKRKIEKIKDELENACAVVEAGIDFPDDIDGELDVSSMAAKLNEKVSVPIKALLKQHESLRYYRDGVSLAIVGKPNVGKSSLLNSMLQDERAIVTEKPGTTRDVISEKLNINGIPIDVLDTAGIHQTMDQIESMGIQKAQDCIDAADMVLFVVDTSQPIDQADRYIYNLVSDKISILVYNKIDLVDNKPFRCEDVRDGFNGKPCVGISAKYGAGLEKLKQVVAEISVGTINNSVKNMIIPNLRHKQHLESCLADIQRACAALRTNILVEMVALDLNSALGSLEDILGLRSRTDILDRIFEQFCIGK